MAETYLQFVIGLFVIDSFGQDGFDPLAQVRNQELESDRQITLKRAAKVT